MAFSLRNVLKFFFLPQTYLALRDCLSFKTQTISDSKTLSMAQRQTEMEIEEKEGEENENENENNTSIGTEASGCRPANRKDKRIMLKKEKRKKIRREMAELARREEESRINDPEELLRLQVEEEQEKLRIEKERREFEEREKRIMEEWERRIAEEKRQEEERKTAQEEERRKKQDQVECENGVLEDGWEYVEDGPPEIIWQGNEIIVKKKKIKVKKKDAEQQSISEDPSRPTSNPLPPQSEAFADHMNGYVPSAQELLQSVAHETPNFGTEQDKAHCPFHLKTGACRFGSRCSRIHFYPDKSCTLLIKNMYSGPGLAWEQDEGLEHTDEDVERAYEEFYEDVHTEFLKFGELVNFKVCRNGSSHLRGNVYVHYKSLDSALLAYQSVNGRYFGGKQVLCEFVGVTRWKVAICGEFMKSKLQTCSRGITCNFIHCFRNPGGDYDWADWDKPPPKHWLQQMAVLFGTSDGYGYDKQIERGSLRYFRDSSRTLTDDTNRYQRGRSQSRENYYPGSSSKYSADEYGSNISKLSSTTDRKHSEKRQDIKSNTREKSHSRYPSSDRDSNRNWSKRDMDRCESSRKCFQAHGNRKSESQGRKDDGIGTYQTDPVENIHHSGQRRRRRPHEKRYEMVDGDHEADLRGNLPDEDRVRTSDLSDNPSSATQLNEMSASPADHGDAKSCTDERNSTGHSTEQSPRSNGAEEFKDKRSKRQRARDSGQNCDEEHVRVNTSKRDREGNKLLDSETRSLRHGGKRSRARGHRTYEATDQRGRWESRKDDYEEHQEFDFRSDEATTETSRWEP